MTTDTDTGTTAVSSAGPSCPVCGTTVVETLARRCERCDTPHHGDCWDYAGGCAIFGCMASALRSPDSSLSSSSLSSRSSLPSPPAFHRWLWTYRLYAWALSVFGLGAAFLVAGRVGLLAAGLVAAWAGVSLTGAVTEPLLVIGAVVSMLVALLVFFAGLVMTLTLLPALILRRRAEAGLALGLAPPREGVRPVLDRLDTGSAGSLLLRLLRFVHPAATVLGWLAFALFMGGGALILSGDPDFMGSVLLGLGMLLVSATWPLAAARDRMAWVETLQNRVAASFKSAKGG